MAIFGADIWAWRHAGAYGSGTSKTPPKVGPLGGPNGPTAISKSSFPKNVAPPPPFKLLKQTLVSSILKSKSKLQSRYHDKTVPVAVLWNRPTLRPTLYIRVDPLTPSSPQDFNEYVFFLFDTDDSGSVSIQELLGGFQKLSTLADFLCLYSLIISIPCSKFFIRTFDQSVQANDTVNRTMHRDQN